MVDLTTKTIKKLFEQQVRELTSNTVGLKTQPFDFRLSGEWGQ